MHTLTFSMMSQPRSMLPFVPIKITSSTDALVRPHPGRNGAPVRLRQDSSAAMGVVIVALNRSQQHSLATQTFGGQPVCQVHATIHRSIAPQKRKRYDDMLSDLMLLQVTKHERILKKTNPGV